MKALLILLVLVSSVLGKETYYQVGIPYTEGQIRLQGTYLVIPDKEGFVSLKQFNIREKKKLSASQLESILNKRFPEASGEIKVQEISYDLKSLKKEKAVHISGFVEKPGTYNAVTYKTLSKVVTQSKPTVFASIRHIILIREGKMYRYDLKSPQHAPLRVLAGDIISVPMKRVIGR